MSDISKTYASQASIGGIYGKMSDFRKTQDDWLSALYRLEHIIEIQSKVMISLDMQKSIWSQEHAIGQGLYSPCKVPRLIRVPLRK